MKGARNIEIEKKTPDKSRDYSTHKLKPVNFKKSSLTYFPGS